MDLPQPAGDPGAAIAVAPQEEEPLTGIEALLTPRERSALRVTIISKAPALSPDTQGRLFALFLQGTDCVEIARLNPGITLGQIVKARIDGGWDERRQEHVEALLRQTRERTQQIALEALDFVGSQLTAAHRLHGDKIKRFIQTGDPNDLGSFSIHGFKAYREALELMKLITGTDGKKVSGEVLHRHVQEPSGVPGLPSRRMEPAAAAAAVSAALAARNGR